jgi:hypothetical protein
MSQPEEERMDCETCQNKHLEYRHFCATCDPWDAELTQYKDMHEEEICLKTTS